MRLARLLGTAAVSGLLLGGSVIIASGANAADYTGYCNNGSGPVTINVSRSVGGTYTWADGSTGGPSCAITTSGTSGVTTWTSSNGADTPSTNPTTLAFTATLTVTAVTAGTQSIIITGTARTYTLNFTVTGGGGGGGGGGSSSSSASSSTSPGNVIQAFGKPTTGTCSDAATESLNWGGASSGGWGESWAQWMNDGTGGFVCSRTLIYSNNLGHWIVA